MILGQSLFGATLDTKYANNYNIQCGVLGDVIVWQLGLVWRELDTTDTWTVVQVGDGPLSVVRYVAK